MYDIEGDGGFPSPHGTMTNIPMSYNLKVLEYSRTPGNIQMLLAPKIVVPVHNLRMTVKIQRITIAQYQKI